MSDLSITATAVIPGANAVIDYGRAGTTIVPGDILYLEAATGTYKLADADSATQEIYEAVGMALNGAGAGQVLAVLKSGEVTLGAVLTAGARYYLSSTPGKIEPEADLSTGEKINLLGLAKTSSILILRIQRPGVTL